MPPQRIERYAVAYNLKAKEYNFYYKLEDEAGSMKVTMLNSADDCIALCNLFRNESPVYYWPEKDYFITGREELRGEELDHAVADVPPEQIR